MLEPNGLDAGILPSPFCNWQDTLSRYTSGASSYIPNLLPETANTLSVPQTLEILKARLGDEVVEQALAERYTDPDHVPDELPAAIRSPVCDYHDGSWSKSSNMVPVNPRALGYTIWGVVPFAFTLSKVEDAIQFLPLFETGVAGSLYGNASWNLNFGFHNQQLQQLFPHLDTVEKQLRAVVNVLHAMGKSVFMDITLNADRNSEVVFANPWLFEWMIQRGGKIIDHSENLQFKAEKRIVQFVLTHGSAVGEEFPKSEWELFFDEERFSEAERLRHLFGEPQDRQGRHQRRMELIRYVHQQGFETVPTTQGQPYRGIEVNPDDPPSRDDFGNVWYEYRPSNPGKESRVFGALTCPDLWEKRNNNENWEYNFDRPRTTVWQYYVRHFTNIQQRWGIDGMRSDMAHVQPRSSGVPWPERIGQHYNLFRSISDSIRQRVPWFAQTAESFLLPEDSQFVYGYEVDHLNALRADTALGALQFSPVSGDPESNYMQTLSGYHSLAHEGGVSPQLAILPIDRDDSRFDHLYQDRDALGNIIPGFRGNMIRMFLGWMLTDMSSYTAPGYTTRTTRETVLPAFHYQKSYLYKLEDDRGPYRTTHGRPYQYERNFEFFLAVSRLREYLEGVWEEIRGCPTYWLLAPPNAAENQGVIAWAVSVADNTRNFVCLVNFNIEDIQIPVRVPISQEAAAASLRHEYSTVPSQGQQETVSPNGEGGYDLAPLHSGECRIYRTLSDASGRGV